MSEFLLSLKVEIAILVLSSIALPLAKWIYTYIISDYVKVKQELDIAVGDIEALRIGEQQYNQLLKRHTGRSYKNYVRSTARREMEKRNLKRSLSSKFTLSRIRARQ